MRISSPRPCRLILSVAMLAWLPLIAQIAAAQSPPRRKPAARAQAPAANEPIAGPELVAQMGHSSLLYEAAFSPDGRYLATVGQDKLVIVWEIATGRELRAFQLFDAEDFHALAFSADGRWLAAESESDLVAGRRVLQMWEVATGRELTSQLCMELQFLSRHTGHVEAIAFSPDGNWLATASWDHTVQLWEVHAPCRIRTLAVLDREGFWSLAFSPDGKTVATGSTEATVKVWDFATGLLRATLPEESGTISTVAYSADGSQLAWAAENTITLWDVKANKWMGGYQVNSEVGRAVESISFRRDGALLAWVDVNDASRVLNVSEKRILFTPRESGFVERAIFSPDGRWLIAANGGWEADSGREIRRLYGEVPLASVISFRPDGHAVATLRHLPLTNKPNDLKSAFEVRDLSTGKPVPEFSGWPPLPGWTAGLSPDWRWLMDEKLTLWDVSTHQPVGRIEDPDPISVGLEEAWMSHPFFSPDSKRVAFGGYRGLAIMFAVDIVDTTTRKKVAALPFGFGGQVNSVSFSPDGRWIAAGGVLQSLGLKRQGAIRVWNAATESEVLAISGLTETVADVAFSPDSQWLAAARVDGSIQIYEVPSGKLLRTLEGHTSAIGVVNFRPCREKSSDGGCAAWDGLLASASWDGTTRLWDARSGELLATLISPKDTEDWLVVSPDGLFDGSPRAWQMVLWRFGGNTFDVAPAEIFFNDFYRPGLLAEILAGGRPKAPRDIARLDRRQPQVKLAVAGSAEGEIASRHITVRLEAAEAPPDASHPEGSGARDVRLFRNGVLVAVWQGSVLAPGTHRGVREVTIPIVAERNLLTAYAFNRDNIKSGDASLTVTGAKSLRRRGTAYVLAVGVSANENSDLALKLADHDAREFADTLKRQQDRIGEFSAVELPPLVNENATKKNIREALAGIASRTQPEDAVFLYFAGHGMVDLDPDPRRNERRFYLVPYDPGYRGPLTARRGDDQRTMLEHSLSDRELQDLLEKMDAREIVLVVDTCHSGQALEATVDKNISEEEEAQIRAQNLFGGPMNAKGLAQLAYDKGMYVLTAAQSNQAAVELEINGSGLFNFAVVEEGLKTSRADTAPRDGQVELQEWLNYATLRVPEVQLEQMAKAHAQQNEVSVVGGESDLPVDKRRLQRPRVFYRRQPPERPLVIARP